MLIVIAFISLFIYAQLHLKDRMVYYFVQQAELEAELLSTAATRLLNSNHTTGSYNNILEYNDFIGVNEVAIFKADGNEAFLESPLHQINANEQEAFLKSIASMDIVDIFDAQEKIFTRFTPLISEDNCISCHQQEGEVLGVFKSTFATDASFELLDWVTGLLWAMGFIMVLTITGLLLSAAIIREKNKVYTQLAERGKALVETYHTLDETKSYLQMILDYSKAIIITTDINGNIVEFNKEAELLTGYNKVDMVDTSVIALCADLEQQQEIITALKKAQSESNEHWEVRNQEVILKTKMDDKVYVSATVSPLMDDANQTVGSVVVCKDISEHIQLQFKLVQSEKLAGIGTLASGVAHEINNPLAGILGMAEIAKDEEDHDACKAYLDDIIRYTLSASAIVKELAAYSRAASSKSTESLDLSVVINDALKMAGHSVPLVSIDIDSDLQSGSYISGNSGEFQQVYINLIVNAIHAMDEAGSLTLTCFTEADRIVSTVTDTGSGIPQKLLNQIYDPFFTTKPAGKGTGLGLYVVYKIVTKYGGTFDCMSTEGKGTTFMLNFPAVNKS